MARGWVRKGGRSSAPDDPAARLTAPREEERWRIVNGTGIHHPMHLHGFHFQVVSRGDGWAETVFPAAERRTVVTERLDIGETMRIAWTPTQAGNWLFQRGACVPDGKYAAAHRTVGRAREMSRTGIAGAGGRRPGAPISVIHPGRHGRR